MSKNTEAIDITKVS